MPTIFTGARWLALAAKKLAEPPRTFSALPNGVSTESRATEPTTRRDIGMGGGVRHHERSEGSVLGGRTRSFAALRMTKRYIRSGAEIPSIDNPFFRTI